MDKIPAKTWVGLLINFLVMIMGIYSMGEECQWDSIATGFAVVMSLAFLTSLVGVVMLVRGNPAGGIVGAVGSAFFIPIGFICLMGCLQSRDHIRFAGYAPGTPATPTPAAPAPNPVDQMPPGEENPTPAEAGEAVIGEAAAGEAAYVESALVEKPLVAYNFTDERPMGCITVLMGLGAGFFLLSSGNGSSSVLVLIGAGIVIMIRGSLRANTYVYALYSEYLECVPGQFSSPVRIPYADILEAEVEPDKAYLYIKGASDREKVTVPFRLIPGGERKEARDAFTAKMRELGVLREQSATE